MCNDLEHKIAQVESYITNLLRSYTPNIAKELSLHGSAVVQIPLKIEKVDNEVKATAGLKLQICQYPKLYMAIPDEEVGSGTRTDHF